MHLEGENHVKPVRIGKNEKNLLFNNMYINQKSLM